MAKKSKSIRSFTTKDLGKFNLKTLADVAESQGLNVEIKFIPIQELKEEPQELINYFVMCSRLSVYTSMGAKNVYHASNKATQLFGNKWSSLCKFDAAIPKHYQHQSMAEFGELIRTLPN